jgi:hypothetical protein
LSLAVETLPSIDDGAAGLADAGRKSHGLSGIYGGIERFLDGRTVVAGAITFRAHTRDADCRAGRRDVKDEKKERDEDQ